MSRYLARTVLVSLAALNLLLFSVHHAAGADRPSECAGLPNGCMCTTQNVSVAEEVRYDTIVVTVECNDVGLTEVPDFSNHTSLKTISLQQNKIKKIHRKDFIMLTSLTNLDLSYNLIDDVEIGSFNTTILHKLYLRYNFLSELPDYFLNQSFTLDVFYVSSNKLLYPPVVEKFLRMPLDLSHNRFTEMPSNSLHRNMNILTLRLSHNHIGRLTRHAFVGNGSSSYLTDLFLVNCSIHSIESGAFYGLEELEDLDLDYNHLKRLSRDMLRHLPTSLQIFSASYNSIEKLDQDAFYDLQRLNNIYLDNNSICAIEARTFKGLLSIDSLSLQNNKILVISRRAFLGSRIGSLYLSWNRIDALHPETFSNQYRLREIHLAGNQLVVINPRVFNAINRLQYLDLAHNQILEIPKLQISSLLYYHLESNNLTYAGLDAFTGIANVQTLILSYNKMKLHNNTLKPLRQLRELHIHGNQLLTHLPSLENNRRLIKLDIEQCGLVELPEDLCTTCQQLSVLSVYSNYLTNIPVLESCTNMDSLSFSHNKIKSLENLPFSDLNHLQILELDNNQITSLPLTVFSDLHSLRDLFLEHNSISRIPPETFNATHNIQLLDLCYNPVQELQDGVFHDIYHIIELFLNHMGIQRIDEHAFPENMSSLILLDLSDNDFDHLPIPQYGWPELRFLYLNNVPSLYRAPGPSDCPKLQLANFTYAYHCCAFKSFLSPDQNNALPSTYTVAAIEVSVLTATPDTLPTNSTHVCEFYKALNITIFCDTDEEEEPSFEPPQINHTVTEIIHHLAPITTIPLKNSLVCYPQADLMTPCVHLFGSWVLRVLVWVVFVVILFVNGLVLTMLFVRILANLTPFQRFGLSFTDNKVLQLYISQLAVADIGICVYLGFLIVVDLKTFDKQEFYQMALSWQYGSGCLIAGFIAILSSELSVYILVLVVLEYIYVFRCVTKTHMCSAILMILFGWLFAGACATLPLIGINSYTTVPICLPFDVISTEGRFYVATLTSINLLAFLFMVICNFYLYCRLRKIMVPDYKMLCVTFVLIVVDFICWAPLIVLALVALSNHTTVNTSIAEWFTVLVLPFSACINPFLYGPLTEKFKHQMQKIFKKILPQNCIGGITIQKQCDSDPIILNEYQNSPGSSHNVLSSNGTLPTLNHHASLPELDTNGSCIGSQKSFLPSNSMPELAAISSELNNLVNTGTIQSTVKSGPVNNQLEIKDDAGTKECIKKNDSSTDKVSSRLNDEQSGIKNPTVNVGTVYSGQEIDEDLQSITSLSDHTINVSKLNTPVFIEETNV